jgi:hypothetical protein
MISTKIGRAAGLGAVAITAAFGFAAAVLDSAPAEARVFIGFGFGIPIGFPFYYPPYPYYPPPAYYPPPPYYPAPASYPAPGTPSQPSGGYTTSEIAGSPSITYTPRRGWTNAQGQYCREYRTTGLAGNRSTERYGTACRDAGGQWRIVN